MLTVCIFILNYRACVKAVSKHSSDIKKNTAPGPRTVFDDPGSATVKPCKTPPCSETVGYEHRSRFRSFSPVMLTSRYQCLYILNTRTSAQAGFIVLNVDSSYPNFLACCHFQISLKKSSLLYSEICSCRCWLFLIVSKQIYAPFRQFMLTQSHPSAVICTSASISRYKFNTFVIFILYFRYIYLKTKYTGI